MSDNERHDDGALVVDRPPTEDKQRLEPPKPYAVIMLNDDFTPFEFVMAVLMQMFSKSSEDAERITHEVHTQGQALVEAYPKDIAETKVAQVNATAQENGHPFKCTVEPVH